MPAVCAEFLNAIVPGVSHPDVSILINRDTAGISKLRWAVSLGAELAQQVRGGSIASDTPVAEVGHEHRAVGTERDTAGFLEVRTESRRRNLVDPGLDHIAPARRRVHRDAGGAEGRAKKRPVVKLGQSRGLIGASFQRAHDHESDAVSPQQQLRSGPIVRVVDLCDVSHACIDFLLGSTLLNQVVPPSNHRRQPGIHRHSRERLVQRPLRFEHHRDAAHVVIEPLEGRQV